MSNLHNVIHSALLAALAKHGQSEHGVMANFDPVAPITTITGYYKLRFVSEDIAKAVQNWVAVVSLPAAPEVQS